MNNINNFIRDLDQLDKKTGQQFLKDFILEEKHLNNRLKALEKFMEVDDGSNYEFLEQLFLSDEDRKVRMLAGKLLLGRYSNQEQLLTLLKFTLDNINDIYQKILALEFLNKIGSKSAIRIIIDYMKHVCKRLFGKKAFRDNGRIFSGNSFTDRILNEGILKVGKYSINPRLLSEEELDTCINICLHDHYINVLGYHATFKGGTIILLNCEGMGLTRISDIIGIERLGKLEHLMLQRNNIGEIDGLEHLKSLKVLNLSGNKIKKIENLSFLKNLEELDLSSNEIRSIEKLGDLPSLKYLDLSNNKISEIQNLNGLKCLEVLNLSHNEISQITGLDGLKRLKILNLASNNIIKISGLRELRELVSLYLNKNKISEIKGLSTLENLRVLNLSNNAIKKISNLDGLKNLTKLELSMNLIRKIEGLDQLTNLQELFLDRNQISSMDGLEGLKSLIILFLESNNITEFREEHLDGLDNLNFIFLNNNKLTPESLRIYKRLCRFP